MEPPQTVTPFRPTHAASGGGALTAEDLGLRYGHVTALEAVSLEIRRGEVVCVLGASGSGKPTLLRLVAGVARPTSGRVLLGR